jgi:two-component system, OmpR family, sensor histidine kinase CssS
LSNKKLLIYTYEEKLSRAFTNIISNCIQYAKTTVGINIKLVENDEIEINIYDDGLGISADDLPNIFDRFYKGSKGNFGLGLAISKNDIEKHKGKITAESSESGASFIITLPAK